ncbi:MAG: FAD-dependent thymidylate synthase [Bacillota bacterium]
MNVNLLAHTQLSNKFVKKLKSEMDYLPFRDGQAVALSAIRTCYSPGKPSEIVIKEGEKYFGRKATDGEAGSEADRLFRMIVRSGHSSTLEHVSFTFAIEGVSRALLAQLTRHRVGFSYSVQSQRYVKFGSGDRSGGFDYVVPEKVEKDDEALSAYEDMMRQLQSFYDELRSLGIPAEDARAVLPQASSCNLVMTANLRAILEFYSKRQPGKGAQKEITELAVSLKDAVIAVEPWTRQFFE